MSNCSRRNFLRTGLAAGVLAGTGNLPLRAARGSATDWVTLGKSGVKVTRLAFGTGTFGGVAESDGFAEGPEERARDAGSRPGHSLS